MPCISAVTYDESLGAGEPVVLYGVLYSAWLRAAGAPGWTRLAERPLSV